MANIAGERFWSAPARVSLQGESARENASACRTFMHRDRCCCGCCCFVPICPLGGSTVVQVGRWRHRRIPLGCSFGYCHLRCGHEPRQTCFRSAPRLFAKESCGAGTVSLKEMRRNEGTVPFIPSEGYRALHSGRKALIG